MYTCVDNHNLSSCKVQCFIIHYSNLSVWTKLNNKTNKFSKNDYPTFTLCVTDWLLLMLMVMALAAIATCQLTMASAPKLFTPLTFWKTFCGIICLMDPTLCQISSLHDKPFRHKTYYTICNNNALCKLCFATHITRSHDKKQDMKRYGQTADCTLTMAQSLNHLSTPVCQWIYTL